MTNTQPRTGNSNMGALPRSNSEETLVTQHENFQDASDVQSLLTTRSEMSEETIAHNTKIFNQHVTAYSTFREFPIVSTFLQPGVFVFSSLQSLNAYCPKQPPSEQMLKNASEGLGIPLLQTSTPVLNIFKKNSPFMIIHKVDNKNEKHVFCKVYFKILANNVTCYILIFQLENNEVKTVVLLNNGVKPSVDLVYENTKIRATGVTGTTSTFANGLIKLFIMMDSTPMLCDDMIIEDTLESVNSPVKNFKVKINESNELYKAVMRQNRSAITKIMGSAETQINLPFATFIDNGDQKIKGTNFFQNGTIRLFDSQGEQQENTNSLIITAILLVLREQEFRKNKGNNKPTFVNHCNN